MRTRIVPIGNSRGIRIPKVLIEQCHLEGDVDLEIEREALVVRPASAPRRGWDDAFQRMAVEGDDALLDADAGSMTAWDRTEWEW